MNSSSKNLLMSQLCCLQWTFWGLSISMTCISARRPLEATALDCCANEVPVMLKYWCWPIYLSMVFHADLSSLSTEVATCLPATQCYISQWSKKIKNLPLLCPEDGATSLSESRWIEFTHLRFWAPELEGREGRDGEGQWKSLSEGDLWAMLPPPAWWERSTSMAAFSASQSLADGIVAHLGRPFMLSDVIAVFISVVVCIQARRHSKRIIGRITKAII